MLTAVTGINWGDEGKGRVIDLLAEHADVVVRYQGGNNAGHTVVTKEEKFVLNLLPSGILHPNVVCVLGDGMVIDLEHLTHEIEDIESRGISITPEHLKLSKRATISMPWHRIQDELEETRLEKSGAAFGSTRRGIAYAYSDKYRKKTLRLGDLLHLKEENEWKIDFEELEKNIRENTKMICLNLPNNPTGTTLDHEEMHQLIQICKKHDLYVLVDEIYRGLYQEESISDLYEKGIATSGLSKVLSTPGLRIGWIKTKDKELIRLINERRDYSIISSGPINDYLGALTLKYSKEILKRNREILEENKCYLKEWLKAHPHLSCVIPKYGTVCFLKYDYKIDSNTFCEKLQEETGVFFVPGCCFDVENHLRFGLANDSQIVKEGLEVFSNWLKKLDTSR